MSSVYTPVHSGLPAISIATMNEHVMAVLEASDTTLTRIQSNRNTYRAYSRALAHFLRWWERVGCPVLSRKLIAHYKVALAEEGMSAASINQRLSPIRKLARELALAGWLPDAAAVGIETLEGERQEGVRRGNWLTKELANQLLALPDSATVSGARDLALLALLVGAGLRRDELIHLTFAHIQQRDGRWAIMDIRGKRGKIRSIPIAAWTKAAVDHWAARAALSEGIILRRLYKGGRVTTQPIHHRSVHKVVQRYAVLLGVPALAPHDLRRTYAKLARMGGASLEQIQLSLGHASVKTTEEYVGMDQSFSDAPADRLQLNWTRPQVG